MNQTAELKSMHPDPSLHHFKNWLDSINSVVTKVIAIGKKAAIGVP